MRHICQNCEINKPEIKDSFYIELGSRKDGIEINLVLCKNCYNRIFGRTVRMLMNYRKDNFFKLKHDNREIIEECDNDFNDEGVDRRDYNYICDECKKVKDEISSRISRRHKKDLVVCENCYEEVCDWLAAKE